MPISSSAAQQIAGNYKLIQAPGFASGTAPLLVYTSYQNDIRQGPLYIQSLRATQVILPYIDRLGDGKTPFSKTAVGFIGGTNGNTLGGVVPSLVGTIASAGGYPLFTAIMDPDNAPYASIAGRQFYGNTKLDVIPNSISGPGVEPAAVDILFQSASGYSASFVKQILNQPAILPSGMCQRNQYRFNETFADVTQRTGSATLYSPEVPSALTGGPTASKTYYGSGISAVAEQVMFNAEDCTTAAANSVVY